MNTSPQSPVSRPAGAITHGKCGSWWTGERAAHCGACCETFSGLTAFDRHQRRADDGQLCRKPADVGLVPVDKPWGVMWSCPSTGANPWGSA